MFCDYVPRCHLGIGVLSQIRQNPTSRTHRFATQSFGTAPEDWINPAPKICQHYLRRAPVEQSVGLSRQDLYQYHHTRDPPDASSTSIWGSFVTNVVAKKRSCLIYSKRKYKCCRTSPCRYAAKMQNDNGGRSTVGEGRGLAIGRFNLYMNMTY